MSKLLWLYSAAPLIACVLLINFVLPEKTFSLYEQAENAQYASNFAIAEKHLKILITKDMLNVSLHRERIRSHFNIPDKIGKHTYRDDDEIRNYYAELSLSSNVQESDIGFYALGYIEVINDEYDSALVKYQKVRNKSLPFLNNSIGYIHLKNNEFELAERFFFQEIALLENQSGAYSNLSKLYVKSHNHQKLERLIKSEHSSQFVPSLIKREYLYQTNQYATYLKEVFSWGNFGLSGLVGAVLILIVWLIFVIRIDVFEREKFSSVLLIFTLGCAFSMLTHPLYDFFRFTLNFRLEGTYINDFFYCIFAIGFIEETVKIIPVLLIMRWKRVFNESTDFVIYASLSGLGFAFMENLLYFDESGLNNIVGRSLSATVLHMSLTSFVAYGLFYAKYKARGNRLGYFLFSFSVACVLHGIYDFWLVSDGWVGDFKIFSVLILVYVVQRYAYAITNVLSHSEFYTDGSQLIDSSRFLAFALFTIATYQYMILAYNYGTENANINLLSLVLSSGFLVFFLVLQLGNIAVSKNSWSSLLKGQGNNRK